MNTTAKALVFAVIAVACAASIGMGLAGRTQANSATAIVKLERVVIVGKRAPMVTAQLPRVVVTGLSLATQLQRQTLAAATPAVRAI